MFSQILTAKPILKFIIPDLIKKTIPVTLILGSVANEIRTLVLHVKVKSLSRTISSRFFPSEANITLTGTPTIIIKSLNLTSEFDTLFIILNFLCLESIPA